MKTTTIPAWDLRNEVRNPASNGVSPFVAWTPLLHPILFFLASHTVYFPSVAYADLVYCDGVWTNRACEAPSAMDLSSKRMDSTASEVFRAGGEGDASARTDDGIAKKTDTNEETQDQRRIRLTKERLVHDVRMKSIAAKREYQVRSDVQTVEDVCASIDTSEALCREEVERLETQIARKVDEQIRREKSKKVDEPSQVVKEENNVAVIIPRRERECRYRDIRHGVCLDDHYPYVISGSSGRVPPSFTPGPFRRKKSSPGYYHQHSGYHGGSYGLSIKLGYE